MNLNRHRKEQNGIPAFTVKEADVIRAVDRWLSLHQIAHFRMNSGALKNEHGRPVRFGAKGMADFYAIVPGKSIWIECKRPSGGVLSTAQREFLNLVNRCGQIGIVVNSVESLEIQLREWGIIP
jgi:hypothetical protein